MPRRFTNSKGINFFDEISDTRKWNNMMKEFNTLKEQNKKHDRKTNFKKSNRKRK